MTGVPPPLPPGDRPAPHAPAPRPVMPLNHPYAGYSVPYRSHNRPTFYHQAARASWVAPIVAVVLGVLSSGALRHGDDLAGLVTSFVTGGLILLGLVLGVVALFGVRKYGRHGILIPACVGIAINGLIVLAGSSTFLGRPRPAPGAVGPAGRAAPRRPLLSQQAVDDSLQKYPGWVGRAAAGDAVVALVEVPGPSPFAADFQSDFAADFVFLSLNIDTSRSIAPLALDTADGRVYFKDGTSRPLMRPSDVYATARPPATTAGFVAGFPAVVRAPAGAREATTAPVFLPAGTDTRAIASVRLGLPGGGTLDVPGAFLSADQKAENIRRSRAGEVQAGPARR